MPRRKRDSFDGLAEVMRQNPKDVELAGEALLALCRIVLVPSETDPVAATAEEVVAVIRRIRKHTRALQGIGAFLSGSALEAMKAPRGPGRPKKDPSLIDLVFATRMYTTRRELKVVSAALREQFDSDLVEAANIFGAKQSRIRALEAMKRVRDALVNKGNLRRGRRAVPVARLRVLAAQVILEAYGYSATEKDGEWLLKKVQSGAAIKAARAFRRLGLECVGEEKAAGLLAAIAEAEARSSREKSSR